MILDFRFESLDFYTRLKLRLDQQCLRGLPWHLGRQRPATSSQRLFWVALIILVFCGFIGSAQDFPTRWEPAIRAFEKMDSLHPPAKGANLFVGSSSIAIWREINEAFPGYPIINRGFGGSSFPDLLQYLDRVVFTYAPSRVFVYEGDNDIGTGTAPEVVLQHAKELRERIAKALPRTEVVFISAKPSPSRWNFKEKYEWFNKELQNYARTTKRTRFVDVWTPMLDKNGVVLKPVFGPDSLHMNKEGYLIWETTIRPFLK